MEALWQPLGYIPKADLAVAVCSVIGKTVVKIAN